MMRHTVKIIKIVNKMILDIEMLRSFYASYSESVAQAKATVKRPLLYDRNCVGSKRCAKSTFSA